MSLEHTTVKKCASQLVSAFVSDNQAIVSFCEEFKHNDLYERLIDATLMQTPTDRAVLFVNEVVEKVKLHPSNYYKLINHLRQNKKYSDVVNVMDAEYFGIRKLPASHEETVVPIDAVYKELLGVKDKWKSIGKGLNIPNERLDLFEGVTDPLLEVIVHWLMRGDAPPSWNLIVLLLRSQNINEAELADRIKRLYCDNNEELTYKEGQTPSDITSGLVKVPIESKHQSFDAKMKFNTYELTSKTSKIKGCFADFLSELQQHMLVLQKEGALDISVIKSHILMYDRKLITPMSQCKSLQDVFETLCLPEHSSFLNYDLIKILAEYGSEKIRKNFMNYKKNLQKFFEDRMIVQSPGEVAVIVDKSITNEFSDCHQLQNQVRIILGYGDLQLLIWEDFISETNPDAHSMSTISQEYPLKETSSFISSLNQDSPATIGMLMDSTSASVHQIDLSFIQQNFVKKNVTSITTADSSSEVKTQNLFEKTNSLQDFSLNDVTNEFIVMVDGAKQLPSSDDQQHAKASEGDLSGIIALIEKGYNPVDKDEHGNTALHYAALSGHLNVLKYFIDELGSDPTITGYQQNSILHYAVMGGHLPVVQYLLREKKVNALCHANKRTTPLHYACFLGYSDIVLELIQSLPHDQDQNIQCANVYDLTPLHLAAANGHLSIVKYLVSEIKCDQTCKSKNGSLPVHIAAMNGQLEVVQFLTADCFLMIADGSGNTALHLATAKGHLNIIQYFIEDRKCNPSIKNRKGFSPLHIAVEMGYLPVVKYLTSIQDYKSYCFDDNDTTLVHIAACQGHLSIMKHLILSIKVDPMCKDKNGMSPLHVAASNNHLNVTEFIVSLPDSTVKATDKYGRTPLHMAAIAGHLDIVQYYIEQQGCNPTVLDNLKRTPLSFAAASGHLSVVKYLTLDQKCDPLKEGANSFYVAAHNGHLEVIQFLFSLDSCTPEVTIKYGSDTLFLAARKGYTSIVKFFVLNKNCDPLCVDKNGLTPLQHAAMCGQIEIIQLYISELNCSPQTLDRYGCSIFHSAAFGRSLKVVKYLIEEGLDPCSLNSSGQSPLHTASFQDDNLSLVKYFTVELKCDPLQKDKFDMSPFTIAIKHSHILYVQFFVSLLKDKTHSAYYKKCNALHLAAITGSLPIVHLLIENGDYDPSSVNTELNQTPLHYAAAHGHLSIVKYLTEEKKCDSVCFDVDGNTPLHLAAESGHLDIVELLSVYAPASEMVNKDGWNALHAATASGHLNIVQFLTKLKGYNSLCLDKSNNTPMHCAAFFGHINVIRYLIQQDKTNITFRNASGSTPLFVAAQEGHIEALKCILMFNNSVYDIVDALGCNALHVSAARGHLSIVKYLVEEQGYSISPLDLRHNTPLHYAAACDQVQVVIYFVVDRCCDFLCKNVDGQTPLHAAALRNSSEAVEFLSHQSMNYPVPDEDIVDYSACYGRKFKCLEVSY